MNEKLIDSFKKTIERYHQQLDYSKAPGIESRLFPMAVRIEPTNKCCFRCIHCFQAKITRKRGMMEMSVFKKVIDEISPLGCGVIFNLHGEPLLHPRFLEMLDYVKKSNLH